MQIITFKTLGEWTVDDILQLNEAARKIYNALYATYKVGKIIKDIERDYIRSIRAVLLTFPFCLSNTALTSSLALEGSIFLNSWYIILIIIGCPPILEVLLLLYPNLYPSF